MVHTPSDHLIAMELSLVLGHGFQPVFRFNSTINNSSQIAATMPVHIANPICSNDASVHPQVRTKSLRKVSKETTESAIRDIQDSSDLECALLRSGEALRVQHLNIILRYFGKFNRWKDVCQLFDWMRRHGKNNIASYSSYIKFVGRDSNAAKALEIYNSIKDDSTRSNVSVCNSTLSCLIKCGKFNSSLKLFNQMKQAGLIPDIITYSTLLSGCAKVKGGYSKAMELVHEMKSRGLSMDDVLYGTLISVCASNNQCDEAEKYFDEMKSEGNLPNVFHYSSLLNAYAIDGNYRKADKVIQDMRSAGLTLNKVILTTLLKVYVRAGLFEKSRELLDELQALGYAEDEMPYCLLMDGLAKSGKLVEAKIVFDEMRRKEVKNDGYSYSIMISALCRGKLIDEAKQLASEFEMKYDKYDVVILNSMLCVYCRSGDMENVMKMMKKMDESAISPDWSTFKILIKYFCKEQLYLLAYRTMEDMHSKGHQPLEDLCVSLMKSLGSMGAYSEAFSVYTMLKYSKRTMNKALHGKILHILLSGGLLKDAYLVVKDNAELIPKPAIKKFAISFTRNGNINLVNDVIKSIHNSNYKIDQDIFHLAISRYIEQPEKKDLLLHLLQWMPGQGYAVDSTTSDMILKNSHFFGHQSIAELMYKHHTVLKTNKLRREEQRTNMSS
ncbi:pentatricopeptide repeat-containing protein At1g10910, chloroplastic-like isoform X1 [Salvia splendens]|uniref:pentatricopeptide repeat-containing protein At1g10910, chloroplastic-like isoform X1 n=1 Tax=Salvia splendens TaxID=180675 RepID=UPI001C26A516|nr:pentatricopeptide repeat-containing protein At1g10910, chloroplastic-like isoform X1 [Salvia splendens]XP_041991658.1 pentatricopeptide repeat-containing protein At1g10910, chloroplastic-like isoform X1 [Salvia splendens]